ncbi:hypothetical protein AVEN_34589-1 [Araneus ventricosus]|uniref:Uncharacterized protein n=1 Tax=Araneus ventricosus TaxID=182803 RepID=A0A4Y2B0N0_ARAVE|nr:hypothetical protein AVEN_34589-1 [Araneus ventricosus]
MIFFVDLRNGKMRFQQPFHPENSFFFVELSSYFDKTFNILPCTVKETDAVLFFPGTHVPGPGVMPSNIRDLIFGPITISLPFGRVVGQKYKSVSRR